MPSDAPLLPELHDPHLVTCADLSVEHVDGTAECLDPSCELAHALHTFQAACAELGRCGCADEVSSAA